MKWIRRILASLAVAYPVALVGIVLLLRYVGEGWWASGVGLYLPRIGFGLPLPLLVVALWITKMRRLLVTQLLAGVILVVPLMGFTVSWPAAVSKGAPKLRILSWNVDSGYFGNDKLLAQIDAYSPDIVALQEAYLVAEKLPEALRTRYPVVHAMGQFIVASRYPVLSIGEPDKFSHLGRMRSAHSVRLLVDSPIGRIALYDFHTLSPRSVFYELRGRGLRREILSGRIFSGAAAGDVMENNEVRRLEAESTAQSASADIYPVVIAGDTNLPGLSNIYARHLSQFQDGFSKAGWGFGYTFQSDRRWMRIDRILATDELRFSHFEVGCATASDHLCVVADLQRATP